MFVIKQWPIKHRTYYFFKQYNLDDEFKQKHVFVYIRVPLLKNSGPSPYVTVLSIKNMKYLISLSSNDILIRKKIQNYKARRPVGIAMSIV